MEISSRREFLKRAAATTCGACVYSAISPFAEEGHMAWAAPSAPQSGGALGPTPLLILVNFDGGCSYNITPIYTGAYRDRNRTISYGPEDSISLQNSGPRAVEQGLHPRLTGLKPVWDQNNLAILNLVGITVNDPTGLSRSHQDGADIRLTGIVNAAQVRAGVTPGWVVRLSDYYGKTLGTPFSGIVINSSRSSITIGDPNNNITPPLSLNSLDALGEQPLIRQPVGDWTKRTREYVMMASDQVQSSNQAMIRNTMANVDNAFAELGRQVAPATHPIIASLFPAAPTGFVRACCDAARLAITPSLKVRFIYLELGGFDTHGEEKNTLDGLLNTINSGLTPLIQALQASGRWNDTVIATLSEFGRTHQNSTGGSDHGAAGSMFVMGGKVKGRQVNPVPSVSMINSGDYFKNAEIDFRHVFREIVAAMGLDPEAIFPPGYRPADRSPLGLF